MVRLRSILELRTALGDDARTQRLIKTVSDSGYQLVGEVEDITSPIPANELTGGAAAVGTDVPLAAFRWVWIWVAAAIVVLLGGVLGVWLFRAKTALPQAADKQLVLVLYFENQSRTPELDWLREGLADMLIAGLSRGPKVNVLGREQAAALANRAGWKPPAPLRLEDALAMSSHARAQALVLGQFAKSGDGIKVTVQVHRARDGALLRTETAIADGTGQIIGAMGQLSSKLARYLGSGAQTPANDSATLPMTTNLEAYRACSMGLHHVALLELPEGAQLLERAVELDPQFAAAYAALGSAYSVSWGRMAEGKPYLEKAASLSNRLTQRQRMYVAAWYALANMDYAEAIRSFRQIVAKYPADAEAYSSLGRLLEGEGQYAEAIETERLGLAADPDHPLLHNFLARVYCRAGLFEQAVTQSQRYVELTGGEPNAYDSVGTSYVWQGKYAEAENAYREALRRKPDFDIALVHLAGVHYREGRYRDSVAECEQYVRIAPADLDQARGNAWLAWIHLRRGEVAKSQRLPRERSKSRVRSRLWAARCSRCAPGTWQRRAKCWKPRAPCRREAIAAAIGIARTCAAQWPWRAAKATRRSPSSSGRWRCPNRWASWVRRLSRGWLPAARPFGRGHRRVRTCAGPQSERSVGPLSSG